MGTIPGMHDPHDLADVSPWVRRWASLIPAGGRVLDLACGSGRHTRFLLARGFQVVAVDRDVSGLSDLAGNSALSAIEADLEGAPWPFPGERFDGIVVTNYLHRPLFPVLLDSLTTGGALIYETFAAGNERFGKPSNPDFLLQPGELLEVVHGRARVIAFEDLTVETPRPACVQRICAIRI